MFFKSSKALIEQTKYEISKLNNEYEHMSVKNKIESSKVRNSIDQKSTELKKIKQQRLKHFDFIRNK